MPVYKDYYRKLNLIFCKTFYDTKFHDIWIVHEIPLNLFFHRELFLCPHLRPREYGSTIVREVHGWTHFISNYSLVFPGITDISFQEIFQVPINGILKQIQTARVCCTHIQEISR